MTDFQNIVSMLSLRVELEIAVSRFELSLFDHWYENSKHDTNIRVTSLGTTLTGPGKKMRIYSQTL